MSNTESESNDSIAKADQAESGLRCDSALFINKSGDDSLEGILQFHYEHLMEIDDENKAMDIIKKQYFDALFIDFGHESDEMLEFLRKLTPYNPNQAFNTVIFYETEFGFDMSRFQEFGISFILKKPVDEAVLTKVLHQVNRTLNYTNQSMRDSRLNREYRNVTDQWFAIFVVDSKGVIRYVNEKLCVIGNFKKEELRRKNIYMMVESGMRQEARKILESAAVNKRIQKTKLKFLKRNGEPWVAEVYIKPILDLNAEVIELYCIAREITFLDKQLETLRSELIDARDHCDVFVQNEREKVTQNVYELSARLSATEKEVRRLNDEVEREKRANEQLSMKLTELKLNASVENIFAAEISRSKRYGSPLCIVFFSIDRMDGFRNMFQDEHMLQKFLFRFRALIQESIRVSDYLMRDTKTDSFILALTETNLKGARIALEKMQEKLDKKFQRVEGKLVTVSFMIAEVKKDNDDDQFLDTVRDKWWEEKDKARSQVLVYGSEEQTFPGDRSKSGAAKAAAKGPDFNSSPAGGASKSAGFGGDFFNNTEFS